MSAALIQATFGKLKDGTWGVKVMDGRDHLPGDCVTITKRDGSTKDVTLGEWVVTFNDGNALWRIEDDSRSTPAKAGDESDQGTRIEGPGAFEFGGVCYIVKPTRDGERLYAKRVVEITADRLNEADEVVQIELVYEKGAMAFLREEHRLDEDRAKELSIRYGRCIVCSHRLKAVESVERGIGPVCYSRLRRKEVAA